MMKKSVLLAAVLSVFSISAWAQMGPSNGGGGDVVVLPNDEVVLADPFLDHSGNQPNNMPPVRSLNPRILQAVQQYAKFSEGVLDRLSVKTSEILAEMGKLATRKNDLRIYAVQSVQELNNFCAPGGKKSYQLPDGALVQNVACTAGNETFLIEPLFLRLTLRDQALLMIHERLTTLRDANGGKNYSAIARFTSGLRIFLEIGKEQQRGKYRQLSETEVHRLTEFYIAIEEIEKRNSEVDVESFMWRAHLLGGGMVQSDTTIGANVLVSLRSRVNAGAVIGDNVRLVNTVVGDSSKIGNGTLIEDSFVVGKSIVGAGAVLKNFRFVSSWDDKPSKVEIEAGVQAHNVLIRCKYNGPCIRNFVIGQNTYLNKVDMEVDEQTRIASGQRLSDAKVEREANEYAPFGYKIKEMNSENSVACPTDGKYWGSDEDRIEIFTTRLIGKEKVFGSDWKYSKCSVKFHTTNSLSQKAPGYMYGLNSNGILYKAGVKIRYRMGEAQYPAMINFLRSQGFGFGEDNQGLYIEAPVVKE
ncbi:hypothetical protein ACLVWU_11900 [Bdellovibrio sp. HCB290]|uniref:hypothetical protein n=1 Tax=Bdellovibrio sp. HCB290 TaxID=3394356 RepID=UPI0039B58649